MTPPSWDSFPANFQLFASVWPPTEDARRTWRLGEAAILMAGGLTVAVEAIRHLISPSGTPDIRWYVFAVIAVALGVDLTRTVISMRTTRRYGSPALRSNGFHFVGDMAGSMAVLIGLLLVRAGSPVSENFAI